MQFSTKEKQNRRVNCSLILIDFANLLVNFFIKAAEINLKEKRISIWKY